MSSWGLYLRRYFHAVKLCHLYRPSLKEVTHPKHRIIASLFDFKDNARYGIYAAENGMIKETVLKHIVSVELTPYLPSPFDSYTIPPVHPIYRKPKGVKNGSGHGPVIDYFAKVYAGGIILEFNTKNDLVAKRIYQRIAAKLNIRTYFRIRPNNLSKHVMGANEFVGIMHNKIVKKPNNILKKFRRY